MVELSVDDLVEIWEEGIKRHGGGDLNLKTDSIANLSSVLHSARYRAELEGGVLSYAGSLLFYLAAAQHMGNGNKRLGWGACTRALEVNGFRLDMKDEAAKCLVLRIADSTRIDHLGNANDVIEILSESIVEADWSTKP